MSPSSSVISFQLSLTLKSTWIVHIEHRGPTGAGADILTCVHHFRQEEDIMVAARATSPVTYEVLKQWVDTTRESLLNQDPNMGNKNAFIIQMKQWANFKDAKQQTRSTIRKLFKYGSSSSRNIIELMVKIHDKNQHPQTNKNGRVVFSMIKRWAYTQGALSSCQYRFMDDLGTMVQCLNAHLIVSVYLMARHFTLYLTLMDLSSSFNYVNQSKLSLMLLDMGMDPSIVNISQHSTVTSTLGSVF
ncbi:hypothetical protein NDU88_003006 [Pleurodeles waltl]|uniref:Reverse transcriptase domain-containing protein n=1 Tax=Pleurodeles waltl TaxID=8319 RepID=A0AAV7KTN7_PLEWA|nr:hypothetical protein NDU88_003006 [Pleurodeles waltl]